MKLKHQLNSIVDFVDAKGCYTDSLVLVGRWGRTCPGLLGEEGREQQKKKDGVTCAWISLSFPAKRERNLLHSSSEDNEILCDGEETLLIDGMMSS